MEKYHFTVILEREEDGGYHAFCPALRGCHTQGDTADEALDNIKEAIEVYLESLRERGEPLPGLNQAGGGGRLSPRLPAVTARDIVRVALKLGFVFRPPEREPCGRESDKARIVLPMHAGKTVKPKTLAGILESMGLTMEGFRSLLRG